MANCVGRVLSRLARKCQIAVSNALQQYNLTAAEEPFLMAIPVSYTHLRAHET